AVVRAASPAAGKADLVRRSAHADFVALGRDYAATLPAGTQSRIIDKTPGNFLYLALVAAALPQARIVHLRRNPMDACHAMYKTLFRMAYPFSYDLDDLARYWLGYDALMAHWRTLLPPERFLEIDYEALVDNQQAVSRRLLAHAGLEWDDACLHFERNPQPTLTASAAQVRQPIYRSSVSLWRRYERELAPLRRHFENAGMRIDGVHAETQAEPAA
ncbi:MAG: sulfotransferase, partial [Stenotrophomonas sp.]